ncbi:mediator of RNA polymerase II transcription subunit 15-like [Acanthaster planci]|uniref:Mediator of RNA polymerase II transcription subunit 15 n=1 Tax=Acanthaster planci TaxID=133434 RepID=A0A8B7YP57_ACAPL|nr:mediator of RNA polymerase II transcription subunit 15-like [Acanthaster planci]
MTNMIPTPGMGTVYPGNEDEWKTEAFRSKVVAQIDDEVHKTGNPTAKSSREMENHVFQKAKNREEYLALVARLMIHMRDINSRKEGAQGKMQHIGGGGQDPMAALQGLSSITMPGSRPGQQGTPPPGQQQMSQMMGARQQQGTAGRKKTASQMMMQQRQKQIAMQLQKQLSGSANSPQPQSGFIASGPQQGINSPQVGGANIGQQMGSMQAGQQGQMIRGQQPFKAQMQSQQMQQQLQQMQASGGTQHVRGQQGFKAFQQQQQQLQQQQIQQQQLQQQQLQQQQLQQQQLQQQQIQQQQQMQQQRQQQSSQQQQRPPASPYGGYPYMMSPQAPPMSPFGGGQPFVMSPQGPPSSPYGGQHFLMSPQSMTQQPSPASQPPSQGSQPMPSPASYLQPSPSPQQASPAGSQRGPPSVPSPSGPLNTPGNPGSAGPGSVGSVGPVPSPGKAQAGSQGYDQQAYAEKRKQLSKYIQPVKKSSKEEEYRKDGGLNKASSLPDSNKMTSQSTAPTASTAVSTPAAPASTPRNICTPLFEVIMQSIKLPTLNHSLQRTFGPAMTAIHGPPTNYPAATPPAKRQKTESDSQTFAVPNIVQGEVARLASKFKVSLDETHHPGGNDVHLICRLEDKRLPSVPPISITVPHSYPDVSPQCDTSTHEYNQTPFLLSVQRTLSSQLKRMPDKFSLTQMLDVWEMCIRKSCLSTISA